MPARRFVGAALAALCLILPAQPADARWARPQVAPASEPIAYMVDDRYPHMRIPEAVATARAWPQANRTNLLSGVVRPLAAKVREIVAGCGARITSGVRFSYVAGTRLVSLHASGRAVDIAGNPACVYAHLRGFRGGVSIDYPRVKHVHISYAPGGREWGRRFAHHPVGKRQRHRAANMKDES
jgi:hypothetical protein